MMHVAYIMCQRRQQRRNQKHDDYSAIQSDVYNTAPSNNEVISARTETESNISSSNNKLYRQSSSGGDDDDRRSSGRRYAPFSSSSRSTSNWNCAAHRRATRLLRDEDEERQTHPRIPFVFQLAKSWSWEAVQFRCQTHPQEVQHARCYEGDGDNILHWCAFGRAPLGVVVDVLGICSELAYEPNFIHGNLPIHSACSYRAQNDVLQALIEAHPESLNIPNRDGSCPLHLLCDYGCSVQTMQLVLSYPEAIRSVSCAGGTSQNSPLRIIKSRKNLHEFHASLKQLRMLHANDQYEDFARRRYAVSVADEIEKNPLWRKFCMLLLVEYLQQPLPPPIATDNENVENGTLDLNHFPVVTACISNPMCPVSLKEMAIYLYPYQLLHPDEYGNLPIHVAVSKLNVDHYAYDNASITTESKQAAGKKKSSPQRPKTVGCRKVSDSNNNMIPQMLRICPETANARNSEGQVPLTCYLINSQPKQWSPVLEALINANPSALNEVLPEDSAIPYVLVWSQLCSSSSGPNEATHNTIFQTLMKNPTWFS